MLFLSFACSLLGRNLQDAHDRMDIALHYKIPYPRMHHFEGSNQKGVSVLVYMCGYCAWVITCVCLCVMFICEVCLRLLRRLWQPLHIVFHLSDAPTNVAAAVDVIIAVAAGQMCAKWEERPMSTVKRLNRVGVANMKYNTQPSHRSTKHAKHNQNTSIYVYSLLLGDAQGP